MNIRKARLMDGHQLCLMMQKYLKERKALHREGTLVEAEKMLDLFNKTCNNEGWIYLVAGIDYKIVAFVSGHTLGWDIGYSGKMGYVQYLYVRKEARGKGIGNDLMEMLNKIMIGHGVSEIEADIPYNPHLIERYSKQGDMVYNGFTPCVVRMRKVVK